MAVTPGSRAGRGRVQPWLVLASDAAALAVAAVAAHVLRTRVLAGWFTEYVPPLAAYGAPGAVAVALCLAALAMGNLYADRRYLSRLEEYAGVAKAVTYALLLAVGTAFFLKEKEYSRGVLLLFWGLGILLLILTRSAWHQVFKMRRREGFDLKRMAAVCAPGQRGHLDRLLRQFPDLGYRVVAHLTAGAGSPAAGLHHLETLLRAGRMDGVLLCFPERLYARTVPYLAWCAEHYVPHHRLSAKFDAYHAGGEREDGAPAGSRPVYAAAKRMIDELAALVLLLVSAPVWLLIALVLKLDSPGPVLFVQERVGRHGRLFRLYKFRTMHAHAPRYAVTVRRDADPRVTRVGRWLRRTSLDELPQLLNVLKGDMSLVGPRPEMPFMMRRNTLAYRQRLQVLPGITGLWQAVARHEPLEESLPYDLYYIRNRSLLLDLVIVGRTVLTVLAGRGAR